MLNRPESEVLVANEKTNKFIRIVSVLTALFLAVISTLGYLNTLESNRGLKRTGASIENTAKQNKLYILSISGCNTLDTPEMCAQRQAQRGLDEGIARIREVDCITRRSLAGLPAPIPPTPCTAQTPPEVYPGM